MQCIAIKHDGNKCSVLCLENTRCKIHTKTFERYGPNKTRRFECTYINKKNIAEIYNEYAARLIDKTTYNSRKRLEHIRYQLAVHDLENLIAEETLVLGHDADLPYRNREHNRLHLLAQQRADRRAAWNAQAQPWQPQPQAELQAFAQDRQNIHTTIIVEKVKKMTEQILKIPVPIEYTTETLKTPGEIILDCNLSKKAASQMMNKYCEEVDIYDLGIGIYPCVLNSVWQYIKHSPNNEDLKKILASELEDNIGMCQQGNLTRLCNILSGYLDELDTEIKSPLEILGEKFAEILRTNPPDAYAQGKNLLLKFQIPEEEWDEWLTPIMDV
jgi:hypothetical protein